jgi:putative ATP-dependent endonuclease of the OLD family
MGTKVGPWAVRLLATPDHELCRRLAVLRDSDLELNESPTAPAWAADHDPDVLLVEHSHPTLEPQLTPGNETLIVHALEEIGITAPNPVTVESVHALFRSSHKQGDTVVAAGAGARRKGEFAMALAGTLRDARLAGDDVQVPGPLQHIFEVLYASVRSQPAPTPASASAGTDSGATG